MIRPTHKRRIGWVITDQLDTMPYWPRIDTSVGGVSLARLHWVAKRVNNEPSNSLYYEVYKPWRQYDGLIFLKAMGAKAEYLAKRYRDRGRPIIFDANVNYYTISGPSYYEGMLPTATQQLHAIEMTKVADVVIADSEYISCQSRVHNDRVICIPDNVEMEWVPPLQYLTRRTRPKLVWSGDPVKLFELLAIEKTLRHFAKHLDLILVTGNLTAMKRWVKDYKDRIERLLIDLNVEIVPYQGMRHLFDVFSQADVVISPRFLDNTYNLGHTEWKITLGMACGCRALASPVPSYRKVWDKATWKEIVLAETEDEWSSAMDELLMEGSKLENRQLSQDLVEQHYSTRVIAERHSTCVRQLFMES